MKWNRQSGKSPSHPFGGKFGLTTFRRTQVREIFLCAAAAVILSGCQGPETRVLPRQHVSQEQPYELTGTKAVLEEVNPFYLQEALDFLSSAPRVCGSDEETNAAEYMKRLLIEYGYDVTIQRFPVTINGEENYGTNVIAVKEADEEDRDILLVTTNHDTAAGSPGANDNASGVVTFLETARLVAKLPADTEIRFVSFSGTEHRRQGVRHYMEVLTERERERMIGVVHLDTLGYMYDYQVMMGTVDGGQTLLGDLLKETAESENLQQWSYCLDDNGGYTIFDRYRIPAVRITQGVTAFEKGLPQDRPEIVDAQKLSEVSQVLTQTLVKIMQGDTPSYLKASQEGGYSRDGALLHRTDRGIPFGSARESVEYYYGGPGLFIESAQVDGQLYQYPMKWLDVDQIILSDFLYQEGTLTKVLLESEAAGIDAVEMRRRLGDLYGEPELMKNQEGEESLCWKDRVGNLNFIMQESQDNYTVEVEAGAAEETELARYSLRDPIDEELVSVRHKAVIELAEQLLRPDEREQIMYISLFTDGVGGQQVYWSPGVATKEQEDSELILHLDLEDMTEPDGNYRDFNESCRLLVRACSYFYYDEYSGLFYEKFDKTMGDEFDIAFQTFVLTNQPESDILEADARTMFFYQYEPLVIMRSDIRRQLNLPL